ncbi:MAG: asparagine synthase (glutamine-hydrolyzing) [Candidatus Binatia bacterium]
MCGIVGGMFRSPAASDVLDGAMATLHHRGPDSTGRWISEDGRWALGHTRLSIIGLDNGAQPMSGADGSVQLVANGEFYGYRAIRDELRSEGTAFSTDSDSEIALHLYLREGLGLTRHLRGEFAVLIADRRNNAMIAVRDRFGIKPLFYSIHDGDVLFASEVKALLAMGVPARWDRESVFQEAFLFRPHERTMFAGIHTVPPGHYAIAQDGDVKLYPYWDLSFPTAEELAKDDRSDEEMVSGFREVLADAVRERLVADVEVASYLSGGIDSCAVLGLAQQGLDRPIRAYTLTFDDDLYDESALAEQQAELVGATYNPIPVAADDLAHAYDDAVWHAETPFVNGHGVAKFLLSRAVRDAGIKVVFTGEGADEVVAGYPPFRRDVLLYNNEGQDPAVIRKLLADMHESNKATRGLLTSDAPPPPELESVRRRLGWVPSWIEVFSQMGKQTTALFRAELTKSLGDMDPYDVSLGRLRIDERIRDRDPLNQALYLWSRVQLPNFVLTFLSDRMEMAHSIEGRVPFLDHRVAEYAAGLPTRMKIKGIREKHVLREAARDVIIEPVYNREKHPFTTPPTRERDDSMLELFADTFASKTMDDQPVFDPGAARTMLAKLRDCAPGERVGIEGVLHRILSTTLMHERFGMTG